MVTRSHARAAAWTAAAFLAVIAGFQFYWGRLGGTWGLHEVSGGAAPPLSASEQSDVVMIGLLDLAFAGVLLVRVGYWREHVPFAVARFARISAWAIVAVAVWWALGNFAGQTDFQRFVNGPVGLIVALLAFVVARSERPVSPGSGAAPTPSGKPGPPTSAH